MSLLYFVLYIVFLFFLKKYWYLIVFLFLFIVVKFCVCTFFWHYTTKNCIKSVQKVLKTSEPYNKYWISVLKLYKKSTHSKLVNKSDKKSTKSVLTVVSTLLVAANCDSKTVVKVIFKQTSYEGQTSQFENCLWYIKVNY